MTVPAAAPDERTLLARPDLADQALEGRVRAAAYRATRAMTCVQAVAAIRDAPDGEPHDELLFGEVFEGLETRGGQVWGRARRDGVVGWVEAAALSASLVWPTHRVEVARAAVREAPDPAARVRTALGLNALVAASGTSGDWIAIDGGGWIAAADLAPFDRFDADPAVAAERLLDAPHATGGRSPDGVGAFGLVQQALFAAGFGAARFGRDQALVGRGWGEADARRGDLVVWADHAGVLAGPDRLIHACVDHGRVVVESLAAADRRRRDAGAGDPVYRRVTV